MSYEVNRPTPVAPSELSIGNNGRQLGEQLFAALSNEEREARMVFAVFDEQTSLQEFDDKTPGAINAETLRQAAIARLLLEQSVDQQTQQQLNQWRAEVPPLPEFYS